LYAVILKEEGSCSIKYFFVQFLYIYAEIFIACRLLQFGWNFGKNFEFEPSLFLKLRGLFSW
jgi:hypothetical protein